MTSPILDATFPNRVSEALTCILGQLCVDGYKEANVGRLLAIRVVKCLEKNVYWYKSLKGEVKKREKRGELNPNGTPYEPPSPEKSYEAPESYTDSQRMQVRCSQSQTFVPILSTNESRVVYRSALRSISSLWSSSGTRGCTAPCPMRTSTTTPKR